MRLQEDHDFVDGVLFTPGLRQRLDACLAQSGNAMQFVRLFVEDIECVVLELLESP